MSAIYRVRQANFLFHMAFHIQKRKLACRNLSLCATAIVESRPVVFNLEYAYPRRYAKTSYGVCKIENKTLSRVEH
jgi:hypothetical protein